MRLRPLPQWVAKGLSWVGGAICLPPLTLAFACLYLVEAWDRRFGPTETEWQPWFAWHPVTIGLFQGEVVWLEPVERVRFGDGKLYRRAGDDSAWAPWNGED